MDIIFFCFTEKWWDWERSGFWGRTAAIAKGLSQHDAVKRLLVVNSPTSIGKRLASGASVRQGSSIQGARVRKARDKVFVLDHTRLMPRERHNPVAFSINSALHDRGFCRTLTASLRSLDMRHPYLWMAGPTVVHYAERIDTAAVVYDAVDEWLAHPSYSAISDSVQQGYEWVRKNADVVFAVTPTLAKRFEGHRPRVVVMPNAANPMVGDARRDVPSLTDIPRPRVGYVGVLQERLDVELIVKVASRMPAVSFVFVGPVLDQRLVAPLRDLRNVWLTGPCAPDEVSDHLHGFDVCILPHRSSELTRNMDPVKLYEYAAAGKTTVASDLPGVARSPELVRVASSVEQWVGHLNEAISGQWTPSPDALAADVAANTWEVRVGQIVDELLGQRREGAELASSGGRAT